VGLLGFGFTAPGKKWRGLEEGPGLKGGDDIKIKNTEKERRCLSKVDRDSQNSREADYGEGGKFRPRPQSKTAPTTEEDIPKTKILVPKA